MGYPHNLIFVYNVVKNGVKLLMAGLERWPFCVVSDHSVNWATTT